MSGAIDALQLRIARDLVRGLLAYLEEVNGRCLTPACDEWAIVRHFDEGGIGWPPRVRLCEAHYTDDRTDELALRMTGRLRSKRPHGQGPWIKLPFEQQRILHQKLKPALVAWDCVETEKMKRGMIP